MFLKLKKHIFLFFIFLKIIWFVLLSEAVEKYQPKILIIERHFPPNSSTAVLNQITGFIDYGYDVQIYSRHEGIFDLIDDDITQYNLMNHVLFDQEKLKKILHTFDIVYCPMGYNALDFLKIKKGLIIKAKLVTAFRGADLSKKIKVKPEIYKELFITCDLFLPVCKYFKKRLIELGCEKNKIKILHSAIDCNYFSFKKRTIEVNKKIKLVSVSRLIEKKGIQYAIEAVVQLVKKYPHLEYTIVGFGSSYETIEILIKKYNLEKNIKLIGRVSQKRVMSILNESDIFVLPSVTADDGDQEGIPNALKEAMAMGIPVVSTYHAGIPELIKNGISGFLVPEKDVNALIKKIDYVINHPKLVNKTNYTARKIIENEYDKQNINEKLMKSINELIKK